MNTTFDAKQAVKFMLDGFYCIDNIGRIFSMSEHYVLFVDEKYIDGQLERFLTYFARFQFKIHGKNLVEWKRPKLVWLKWNPMPSFDNSTNWMDNENDIKNWLEMNPHLKVLEWETKLFPATWEECE